MKYLVRVLVLTLCLTLVFGATDCTCDAPPLVTTNDATGVAAEKATLNGDLTALGGTPSVDVSFQWGTKSKSYSNETTAVTRTDTGTFSIDITGLELDTTYYFRAKAVGDGKRHGSEKSFKTRGLVTNDASQIVLTLGDLEAGWNQNVGRHITSTIVGAQSAYEVNFTSFSSSLNIKVAVFPSIALAKGTYSEEIPTNVFLDHPSVGDECFLPVSQFHQHLVFRKTNVVVWVSIDSGDAVDYATKVEAKLY